MSMLKYTVEFSIDDSWIADGFDLTDERAKEMLARNLPYAFNHELNAKVIKAPDALKVAKLQGYHSATHINAARSLGKFK